ncbi:nuclease SbcCD subunit D [Striga asiatica]|uniref:Nuclease SbcCD subunit D n=1 Tax=Striga asiatica TaxID=4170 RepID=A0A5A7QKL3_STRAF|nr:nuclease SbcCD subunit D [Striga asiatica]
MRSISCSSGILQPVTDPRTTVGSRLEQQLLVAGKARGSTRLWRTVGICSAKFPPRQSVRRLLTKADETPDVVNKGRRDLLHTVEGGRRRTGGLLLLTAALLAYLWRCRRSRTEVMLFGEGLRGWKALLLGFSSRTYTRGR